MWPQLQDKALKAQSMLFAVKLEDLSGPVCLIIKAKCGDGIVVSIVFSV